MLSSDLRSVVSPKLFTRDVQESPPRDCEVEAWAMGRLKCLPDTKDIEKDSTAATHVSHDESKVVNTARNPWMYTTEGVDKSPVTEVEGDDIDSDEENENLSKRLQLLRS